MKNWLSALRDKLAPPSKPQLPPPSPAEPVRASPAVEDWHAIAQNADALLEKFGRDDTKEKAFGYLKQLGPKPVLEAWKNTSDDAVIDSAVPVLALIGPSAIPALLELMDFRHKKKTDIWCETIVPIALQKIGIQALPALESIAKSSRRFAPETAYRAFTSLVADLLPKPERWPRFSKQLAGNGIAMLKVTNQQNHWVIIALRAGEMGADFLVPSQASREDGFPHGNYEVFVWFPESGSTVFQGDNLVLQDNRVELTLTEERLGNYPLRRLP